MRMRPAESQPMLHQLRNVQMQRTRHSLGHVAEPTSSPVIVRKRLVRRLEVGDLRLQVLQALRFHSNDSFAGFSDEVPMRGRPTQPGRILLLESDRLEGADPGEFQMLRVSPPPLKSVCGQGRRRVGRTHAPIQFSPRASGKLSLRLRRHRVEEIGLQGGRVSVWPERISPTHTNTSAPLEPELLEHVLVPIRTSRVDISLQRRPDLLLSSFSFLTRTPIGRVARLALIVLLRRRSEWVTRSESGALAHVVQNKVEAANARRHNRVEPPRTTSFPCPRERDVFRPNVFPLPAPGLRAHRPLEISQTIAAARACGSGREIPTAHTASEPVDIQDLRR